MLSRTPVKGWPTEIPTGAPELTKNGLLPRCRGLVQFGDGKEEGNRSLIVFRDWVASFLVGVDGPEAQNILDRVAIVAQDLLASSVGMPSSSRRIRSKSLTRSIRFSRGSRCKIPLKLTRSVLASAAAAM